MFSALFIINGANIELFLMVFIKNLLAKNNIIYVTGLIYILYLLKANFIISLAISLRT